MGTFISDPTATLPGPKVASAPLPPGRDPNKRIRASDYNAMRDALLDVKVVVERYQAESPTALAVASAEAADVSAAAALASATSSAASEISSAGSETAAGASAVTSSANALAAQAAQVAAETAAGVASGVSGIYTDTTAGLAATPSGGYFFVPAGPSQPDILILYLDNAGVAVEKGRKPSSVAMAALRRAVLVEMADSNGDLDLAVDAEDRVYRRTDAAGGLHLAGMDQTVQETAGRVSARADAVEDLHVFLDADDQVVGRIDRHAGLRLAGLSTSAQHAILAASASAKVALPSGWSPGVAALRGAERYIWTGMPREFRLNSNLLVAYPFRWDTDPVTQTMIKRRTAAIGSTTWTTEDLTINDPGGFYPSHQWRDVSFLYDRALAKYFAVINNISSQATGYRSDSFSVWQSTDGLTWDFITYVVAPGNPSHVWSPEFFIDDDGTVFVIVSITATFINGQPGAAGHFGYHIFRCDTPTTMATWTYVGQQTGSKLPQSWEGDGSYNGIDPFMLKRDGIYYVIGQTQNVGHAAAWPYAELRWAAATNILGPFEYGAKFLPTTGTQILGEGQNLIEMPAGSQYRWRCYFDDVLNNYTGQQVFIESNDLTNWTNPVDSGMGDLAASYHHHASVVLGLP